MSLFKAKFPNVPTKDDAPKSLAVALGVARQQKQRSQALPQYRGEEVTPRPSSLAEAILAKRKASAPTVESEEDLLAMDLMDEGLDEDPGALDTQDTGESLESDMDMVSAIRKRMKERRGV